MPPDSEHHTLNVNQPSDNDPTAAAAARARIEALGGGGFGTASPPTPQPAPDESAAQPAAAPQAATNGRRSLAPVKPILGAIGSFLLILLLFKSPVLINQLKYKFYQPPAAAPAVVIPQGEAVPPEPIIQIPKINVSAPVVYEPSTAEAKIQESLRNGVVHYGTTAKPGEPGNVAIVGHSSNDWWQPGNYKFIFVLLDKLSAGDTLSIHYQSRKYVYQVSEVKIVEPTDLGVLAPTAEPTVTLITCTPPGTNWKRLIVRAKQISPEPVFTELAASQTLPSGSLLPSNAPSFAEQFSRLWDNILNLFR